MLGRVQVHAYSGPASRGVQTCLRLNIVAEDLSVHIQQVICHGLVCPFMDDWGYWVKASAVYMGQCYPCLVTLSMG